MKTIRYICTFILGICVQFAPIIALQNDVTLSEKEHALLEYVGVTQKPSVEPLSRSQLAKLLVECANLKGFTANYTFYDVPLNDEHAQYISSACSFGLMSGKNGGFVPEGSVSFYEAISSFVILSGYKPLADYYDIVQIASNNGITKGISYALDQPVSATTALKLAYNTLKSRYLEVRMYTHNEQEFSTASTQTVVEKYFNITEQKGQIVSAGQIAIEGNTAKAGTFNIKTGSQLLNVVAIGRDLTDFLGLNVTALVQERNEEYSLVFLEVGFNNTCIEIQLEDIGDFSNKTLQYFDNGRKRTVTLDENVIEIYNGDIIAFDASDFRPDSEKIGLLRLLDFDNDSSYDLAIIKEYQTIFVEQITNSEIFFDKNSPINLDSSNYENVNVKMSGETLEIEDISVYDVLNVLKSKTRRFLEINVEKTYLDGKLETISEDHITIGGTEYKTTQFVCLTAEIGENYRAYFDSLGRVVGLIKQGSSDVTGVVLSCAGDGNSMEMRILLQTGMVEDYNTAYSLKVSFDGGDFLRINGRQQLPQLAYLAEGIPIRFAINENRQISALYAPSMLNTVTFDEHSLTLNNSYAYVRYKENSFKLKYFVGENTLVFNVGLKNDIISDEFDDHAAGFGASTLKNDYIYKKAMVFQSNEERRVGVVVVFDESSETAAIDENNPFMLVEKVTVAQDANGNTVRLIYGIIDNTYTHAYCTDIISGSNVLMPKPGDVAQISLNKFGQIASFKIHYSPSAPTMNDVLYGSDPYEACYLVRGNVVKLFANTINIQYSTGEIQNVPIDSQVYVYDGGTSKVSIGTISQIVVGSTVIIKYNAYRAAMIMVLNE